MAPKVSKQRRDEGEQSVLDALASQQPGDPNVRQQEPPAHEPNGNGKPQLTATEQLLLSQIEQMGQRLERLQNDRPLATYTPPQLPQLPAAPPALDLNGLPDPVTQGAQYNTELARRVQAHYDATREHERRVEEVQRTSVSSREGAVNGVWTDFQIQYPELAEQEDRVQFVAQKVTDAARKRGIDPDRYIFGNSDRFMADVAKEYERIFGPVGGDDQDGSPDAPPARHADIDDAGRTAGIFGGAHSQAGQGRGSADKPGDMIKDLQDRQRKSGFF